jgi:hypothetical protein
VGEEGFSYADYFNGLKHLSNEKMKKITALCMPGVGDPAILEATHALCHFHKSFLITDQKDLFDFLTSC